MKKEKFIDAVKKDFCNFLKFFRSDIAIIPELEYNK